jgi:hypothetical protein
MDRDRMGEQHGKKREDRSECHAFEFKRRFSHNDSPEGKADRTAWTNYSSSNDALSTI